MPQNNCAPNLATHSDLAVENARLRAWLGEIANCRGDNTLSEQFARRIRYIARRALAGDTCGGTRGEG